MSCHLTYLELTSLSRTDPDKAPRLSIRRVIWTLAFDSVIVKLDHNSQMLRRKCCFNFQLILILIFSILVSTTRPGKHFLIETEDKEDNVNAKSLHGDDYMVHLKVEY